MNESGFIDLHTHSSCSDGTFTPTELARYAAEKGLAAFALTDHDTVDGLTEAAMAASACGLEFVPGIEFSTEYQGRDIHIVGLDIHPEQADFSRKLLDFQKSRDERNAEMLERLRTIGGFDLTEEELRAAYGQDTVLTRAHFGRMLFEKGYVSSISEAFDRYLGDRCPCFVPRKKTAPEEAVGLILAAGGIPVLAHPLLYGMGADRLTELTLKLKNAGLKALEALYSTYTARDENQMRRLARQTGLQISGGSDFHGKNKPFIDLGSGRGNLKIPYEILEQLRKNTLERR